MKDGQFTLNEILTQPEGWAETLEYIDGHIEELKDLQIGNYDEVLFTGCGSTYYLAQSAARLFRATTGEFAEALPGSEIWLYPETSYNPNKNTLLVAISRSGKTSETVNAVRDFRLKAKGSVLTLSGYAGEDLSGLGDINLMIEAAKEESIAQTRAFSSLFLAITAIILIWSERNAEYKSMKALPEIAKRLLNNHYQDIKNIGANLGLSRFYFLGSGVRLGLANELSLKMKEMTLSHSEAFHCLEFRHGPMAMVNESTLIIGLISKEHFEKEIAVLNEMHHRGAKVISFSEKGGDISFESGLSEIVLDVLFLPLLQALAYERSLAKGLNPDKPNNLEAVVVLT